MPLTMSRRGRRSAVFWGLLAVAVPAAGVLGLREALVVEWYVWKLRSGDRTESDLAAAKLAELDSARAAEPLILAIRRDGPEAVAVRALPGGTKGGSRMPLRLDLPPKAYALYRLGGKAVPAIDRALKEEDSAGDPSRFVLFYVRSAIGGEYAEVISKAEP